ncbi:MAG: putative toxin-antitoxin system toxin component, PIN family [Lachnospiraceae bacterium]|nr:putative toxin-antitoxin system toxin component, PIN family [Lachnospiraceae bacterium]
MNYYAVIDTNVLVSAMLHWKSVPGSIIVESLTGRITPLLNDKILTEYREVLSRPKFRFSKHSIEIFLDDFLKRCIYLDAGSVEEQLPDPNDTVFYEIVMEARKNNDAYLITGNKKHFPVRPFIVTPREMMDIINS